MGKASRRKRIPFYIRTSRVPETKCPGCGTGLTGATGASPNPEHNQPKPGYPTVCCYCGELLVFDSRLAVHRPTPEMAARLLEQYPLIAAMQKDVRSGQFRMPDKQNSEFARAWRKEMGSRKP